MEYHPSPILIAIRPLCLTYGEALLLLLSAFRLYLLSFCSCIHTYSLLLFLCIQFCAAIQTNLLQVEHWLVLVGGFSVDEQPNADVAWRLDVAAGSCTLPHRLPAGLWCYHRSYSSRVQVVTHFRRSYSSGVLSDHR